MATYKDIDPQKPVLVLFREDLRIADNGALAAAANLARPIVAAFIFDKSNTRGAAANWWLHHSLEALSASLKQLGLPLVLRRGPMSKTVAGLVGETGAGAVFWNRRFHPAGMRVDAAMTESLQESGIIAESFDGHILHNPAALKTSSSGYYKVYSPFWRALEHACDQHPPLPCPKNLKPFANGVRTERLHDWRLLPSGPDWAAGLQEMWEPGETGAHHRLSAFLDSTIKGYAENRDFPGENSTSLLSPHLAHGEITPRQIRDALANRSKRLDGKDALKFRKEIAWREFSYHLLFHNPELANSNFNRDFDAFPWNGAEGCIDAWRRGRTGYPFVDAGMRELWRTGWMHNRVRMVAASFLVKHLLIDWRVGERWFRDTLVDADPANNPASWQWVAGSGADAAPYFRIFNPVLQGRKFDPGGSYIRNHVPELAGLPDEHIHSPWTAPAGILRKAGVTLGETYPLPIVDHEKSRQRALDAYRHMRGAA